MAEASELGVGRPTKRRAGSAVGGLPVAESRPQLVDGFVLGERCSSCRHPLAQTGLPWCPVCYGPLVAARFSASGTVWSATVVHIPVNTRRPPFGLAYVDLDEGPRVLVHLAEARVLPIDTRVTIPSMDGGDLLAVVEGAA